MLEEELLKIYVKRVNKIRKYARSSNLSDKEINILFEECFHSLKTNKNADERNKFQKCSIFALKTILILTSIFIICYVIINVHKPTASVILQNVQSLIYPGFSLLRYLSVPILKHFPSLTELYDETCLVENPFFYVYDMECWPCQQVYSVVDLTGYKNRTSYPTGMPYVYKSNQKHITFDNILEIYKVHKEIFDRDASRLISSNKNLKKVEDLLFCQNSTESSNVHIAWRINRMVPARIIRSLFPKPDILSEWSGQSVERYIMIDQPQTTPHTLPSFECSYIFVIQGSGQQTIILKPTRECAHLCKTVSVILKPSYVLWYNWWYWKPISLPAANATETSISYINSYC